MKPQRNVTSLRFLLVPYNLNKLDATMNSVATISSIIILSKTIVFYPPFHDFLVKRVWKDRANTTLQQSCKLIVANNSYFYKEPK